MRTARQTNGGIDRRSILFRGGLAVVLSVVANVAIAAGARQFALAPGFRALQTPPVAFLSAVGAAGATAVYVLVRRYAADPDRTFLRIATAVLVVSILPDFALPAFDVTATIPGVLALVVMHVVVAAVSVGLLVYWRR